MNEGALRDLIREHLADGRLPAHRVTRILAGYGDGSRCAACDRVIQPADVAYSLTSGDGGQVRTLVLHYACFRIWERERDATGK